MSSDGKAPGFWFYTTDYEQDMQMLSLAAQGLWMRMLCWMHANEAHRGFLELPNGRPMTVKDIARRVGKHPNQIPPLLEELDSYGVGNIDERGCRYNRRMARDTSVSEIRKAAANKRLERARRAENGTFAGDFAGAKRPASHQQNPSVSVSDSDTTRKGIFPTDQNRSIPSQCPENSACGAFLKIFTGERPSGTFQQFLESVPSAEVQICLSHTALWMNTPKYQTGYGKDAVQFLKQGIWRHPPPDTAIQPNGKKRSIADEAKEYISAKERIRASRGSR